mmetsp:Transcript_23369/g.54282  ORF Transcript_23369/g.54282 Transcript_23369/m.54282 type:complete len:241 (-) Transcript_23369:59-781(-)|eukprot:CAMPEP_0116848404 /NCGR_PEP_ID=MMETSP0418-20121206/14979_1 /TAXON_ID=1158023 /ORGANISM="Astrosyne radiata, Strain 13vi08-1A" /LENGTH=240 /DNA_ID=CAMNT_0004479973 /DNA_START=274 /DNA_END=996 /DNA_ORIENTATION=+
MNAHQQKLANNLAQLPGSLKLRHNPETNRCKFYHSYIEIFVDVWPNKEIVKFSTKVFQVEEKHLSDHGRYLQNLIAITTNVVDEKNATLRMDTDSMQLVVEQYVPIRIIEPGALVECGEHVETFKSVYRSARTVVLNIQEAQYAKIRRQEKERKQEWKKQQQQQQQQSKRGSKALRQKQDIKEPDDITVVSEEEDIETGHRPRRESLQRKNQSDWMQKTRSFIFGRGKASERQINRGNTH